MLNTLNGVRDETGASLTSWAIWTRACTVEENRHGDLLNKYLYLSGRVDMRQIEKTIQYSIGSGMGPRTENSPYLGFIYTSFRERATLISHGITARLAKEPWESMRTRVRWLEKEESEFFSGLERNYTKALEWLTLASQRLPSAYNGMGYLYLNTIDLNPETLPDIAEAKASNTDEVHAFSFC
ncbi:hypothetical protein PVL29_015983 [Vitis rotundifolia]|uniref:Uncharacterized protein n=1 Tax=Vitis rotundifolia TaxID=103349 RepID=A0AA39DK60_VITRO|nr:hypothetical protein PVL29_015983 [Vitis rotundifolia]